MKEIDSVRNPDIQALRRLSRPRERQEAGLFLAEGAKLTGEALSLGLCKTLLVNKNSFSKFEEIVRTAQLAGCEVFLVSDAVMHAVCEAKTPQGVACVATMRAQSAQLSGRFLLALDGVQDPGNVGTIVRTADAAGFSGVLFSSDCADLYGQKALRATMGSALRMDIQRTRDLPAAIASLRARGYDVAAATLGGDDFYASCPRERAVLVIGNEGNGISEAVLQLASHRLTLPMRGGAESLNAAVAAGIMMYEMTRGLGDKSTK